jgi:hypothetical protein
MDRSEAMPMSSRLPIGPATRAAFAGAAVWVITVAWLGRADVAWWGWPIRVTTAAPVVVLCVATAVSPRIRVAPIAAASLVAWATIQALRVQWADFGWRALLVASTTYALVALLALALGVQVATIAGLTCAGRRAASDATPQVTR